MEENHEKSRYICPPLEQRHRDERILCNPRLAVDEREYHHAAHHKQCNDLRGVPWKKHTTKVETEKKHESAAEEGEYPHPIDGFHPIDK